MKSFHTVAIPFHANIHSVGDHNHYCFYDTGTVGSTKKESTKKAGSSDGLTQRSWKCSPKRQSK